MRPATPFRFGVLGGPAIDCQPYTWDSRPQAGPSIPGEPLSDTMRRGLQMNRAQSYNRDGEIVSSSKLSRIEQAPNLSRTRTISNAAISSPILYGQDPKNGYPTSTPIIIAPLNFEIQGEIFGGVARLTFTEHVHFSNNWRSVDQLHGGEQIATCFGEHVRFADQDEGGFVLIPQQRSPRFLNPGGLRRR